MQAHQLRAQSKEDADELIAEARKQAAERLHRVEEQLRSAQDEAAGRLRELEAKTASAAAAHRKVLEELRLMAADLERLAGEKQDRIKPTQADEPTGSVRGAASRPPAPADVASDETIELPAPLPARSAEEAKVSKVRRLPRSARGPS